MVTGIPREGNNISRLCYEGADITGHHLPREYKFRGSRHDLGKVPLASMPSSSEDTEKCPDHTNCTGHIDRVGDSIVMPRSMCAYYGSVPGEAAKMREGVIAGSVNIDDYRKYVASGLRGKRGVLRYQLSSFRVNSSIRAVIVPGPSLEPNCIGIPRYILDQVKVVDISDPSNVKVRRAVDGDYMIVIRPPCLASGSAQPMRIVSLESSNVEQMNPAAMVENGLSTALQFPLESCRTYNADFDGDEVQGNIVTSPESIQECKVFEGSSTRSFSRRKIGDLHRSKYRCEARHCVAHGMMSSTVTLDTDMSMVDYEVRATGLKDSHMSAFLEGIGSGDDECSYYNRCLEATNAKMLKVSMQSESGYIGRRARVAASMIHTNVGLETVSMREVSNDVALGVSTASVTVTRGTSGGYGNPAIRVISKLTAGIMQEMLTVKVATQPPSGSMGGSAAPGVSPVMDVLMGCNNTMVMCRSGSGSSGRTLRVLRDVNDRSLKSGEALEGLLLEDITASYSPVLLRHIEAGDRRVAVAKEGLSMVLHCARRSVDVTEFHAILCMLMSAVERGRNSIMYSTMGSDTGHLRWLPSCHSIYYSTRHPCYGKCLGEYYSPLTLSEGVMLCNYSWLRSIALT